MKPKDLLVECYSCEKEFHMGECNVITRPDADYQSEDVFLCEECADKEEESYENNS